MISDLSPNGNYQHPMSPTDEQLAEWDFQRFDETADFRTMMIAAFRPGADASRRALESLPD